ncbi:MAG: Uma2 family endonuclease, partial [Rhizobacter sp.]|nr:Uma2 family endonuclease [Chlorobiales bacterium]
MTNDVQAAEKQEAEKLLTEEDLWPLIDQGRNVGLRKGKLVELGEKDVSPAGRKHGKIANRIAARITVFVDEHDLGSCFAAETGFIVERTPQTMLAPDFAFITKERDIPQETGFGKVVPDFVAEVISPRDTLEDVEEKVGDWLTAGVKLVWTANMKTK